MNIIYKLINKVIMELIRYIHLPNIYSMFIPELIRYIHLSTIFNIIISELIHRHIHDTNQLKCINPYDLFTNSSTGNDDISTDLIANFIRHSILSLSVSYILSNESGIHSND